MEPRSKSKLGFCIQAVKDGHRFSRQIEIYIASHHENMFRYTPEYIKKELLKFFPEMDFFFKYLEETYGNRQER